MQMPKLILLSLRANLRFWRAWLLSCLKTVSFRTLVNYAPMNATRSRPIVARLSGRVAQND